MLAFPVMASAAIGVNKTFSPTNVSAGQTSTLTVILINNNAAAATGAAFTDNFPGSVVVAATPNASTTCAGGAVTATPGAASFAFAGGTIPAAVGLTAGTCTVQVDVQSPTSGVYINTIPASAVASSQGSNAQNASATLTVAALRPATGAKSFNPTFLHGSTSLPLPTSRVTLTLTNPNGVALAGATLTDTLPATLAIAPVPNTATTCGAGTVTTGAASATLSGGTIPANGNCTVQFDVVAANSNAYSNGTVTNTIAASALTTTQGVTNAAAFSGNVTLQTGARVEKSFVPTSIVTGGIATLTVTVRNFNVSPLVNSIAFTDPLPGTMRVAAPVTTSTTCASLVFSPAPAAGDASFTVNNGSLPGATVGVNSNANCTLSIAVTATNAAANPVTLTNTIPVGNFGGVGYSSAGAGLIVTQLTSVGGSKSFSPSTILQGQVTTLTITLTNSAASPATITSFTDALTTLAASPQFTVAAAPAATTTCGGALTATPGTTSITLGVGNVIPANGSCQIVVPVQAAANATTGALTNTIAQGALITNQGRTQTTITAPLTVTPVLSVAKAFAPATVAAGADTRLTITLTRAANATSLSGLAFPDTLPALHVVSATPNLVNNCGGTVTAAGSTISLAGGSLAGGAAATSCTILVNVTTPAGAGAATNTIAANAVTSTEGYVNRAAASATITRVVTSVTVNKSFTPATVLVGGQSTLSINFLNTNANAQNLTAAALTDTLPVGMTIGSPLTTTNSCGGTLAAVVGGGSIALSNVTLNANATCIITVKVVANASGNLTDTLPVGAFTSAQGVTNPLAAQATLAATGSADLSISKTDGVVSVVPGTSTTYTIVAKNLGPNDVAGAGVVDNAPAGMTFTGWTCTASAGSACGAPSGSGNINQTVTLLNGGSATYTVTAAIAVNATGSITNTATVVAPGTVIDTVPGNNTASDTNALTPQADVAIIKTGTASVNALGAITYTLAISNAGPSSANGATFTDAVPAGITGVAAVCGSPLGGAVCPGSVTVAGNNVSGTIPTLPPGGSVVITITGTAPANAASLTNTGTVAVPPGVTDTNPGNNSSSAPTTVTAVADVAVVKTGPATVNAAGTITYLLTISNAGPSAAGGATFSDAVPAGITGIAAVCGSPLGGAACPGSVTVAGNNVSGIVPTLPAGGSVIITITGTAPASGSVSNTATVAPPSGTADPTPGNNSSSVTTTISPVADVAVVKSGPATVNAAGAITYTLTISNNGPSIADGATFSDTVPAGITGVAAGCGSPLGGAACPGSVTVAGNNVSGTIPTLPKNGSVVITITGTAPASGSVTNTATVAPPSGTTDSVPGNNSSSVTTTISPVADVAVVKTGPATVNASGTITYLLTISNAGPSAADGATFSDAVPAGITGVAAVCGSPLGGAACPGSVTVAGNNVSGTIPTLPKNGSVVITITGTAPANATSFTNTAIVAPPPGTTDPTPGNNSSSVPTSVTAVADVAVVKTGPATVNAAGAITYTLTISNNGPSIADGATFSDAVPAGIIGVAAVCGSPLGGAACPGSVTVAGNNVSGIVPTLPAGGSVVITITGTAPASGSVSNTATVAPPSGTADPTPGNNSSSVTTTISPVADVAVVKSGPATVNAAGAITYTLTISNNGPSIADGATFSDTVPAGITGVAAGCGSPLGGAACPGSVTVAGNNVSGTIPTLPKNGSVVITITGTAPANATSVTNTATVTAPSGTTDPAPGNNSSSATTNVTAVADVAVVKTGPATVNAAGAITYTLTISNNGPSIADGATFSDTVPAGITGVAAGCGSPLGGAACPGSLSVVGNVVSGTIPTLPKNGSVVITITGTAPANATSFTNTAIVAPPPGTTDPTPGNNSSSVPTTVSAVADVAVVKTGPANVNATGSITYSLTISNAGPSNADGATFSDAVPAGITGVAAVCGSPLGGAACPGSVTVAGNNVSGIVPTLPKNGSVVITITGTAPANATSFTNTAIVAPPSGTTDPTPGNNSSSVPTTVTAVADVAVVKTGPATVNAAGSITYLLTISNAGPSNADGATFSDAVPAGIIGVAAVCGSPLGGAACPGSVTVAGNNVSGTIPTLPKNGSVVITITGTAPANATSFTNTAIVAPPPGTTDPTPGNNSSSVPTTVTAVADLAITKTDGVTSVVPGTPTTYTIVVTNNGPSNVTGATVMDSLPAAIASATWTAIAAGGATGFTVSGSGNIADTVDMPLGSTITYTVVANVASSATGTLVNTASVSVPPGTTDPVGGNNSATDTNTLVPQVTLAVVKTDGSTTYTPGGTAIYMVTVTNIGPSDAADVGVLDGLPPGLTLTALVTCTATGNATCAPVTSALGGTGFTMTGARIAAGLGNSLVFTVPVAFASSMTAPSVTNTAVATDAATGATASGADTNTLAPNVTLAVTKDDGSLTYTPGGTATYKVTITHGGLSDATNVTISDPLPAGVTLTASANCVAVGTANCGTVTGTAGQSSFGATGASIAAGPGNSLVFTAPVAFAASLATDPLDNTASATDVLSGATGQGTDSNQRAAQVTLAMTKDDGSPTYTPGGTAIYVVTVANTGASDALNVSVDDTLPIGVLLTGNVTCAVTGSAVCGTVTGSAGQVAFNAVGARINAGAGNSLKFTVPVAFASSLADNPLINTATVKDLASNATGSASDSNTLARQADLAITKDDGVTIVVPGGTTTYTIVATNAGPSDVLGAKVVDTLPAAIVGATWTAVAAGGATGFTPSGAGNINDTVDMPAGSKITYTLVATISSGATGTLSNTASIVTPVGVTDPNPANNSATDTNTLAAQADLAITKTDGVTSVVPGGTTTYTIVVTNSGPSDAVGATVSDPLPPAITVASYTATATGGAAGFTASGAGSIADTVNMPAGSTITYALIATISATATGSLANTATVAPPATVTDPNPGNNSATDTNTLAPTADLSISKNDGITSMPQGGSTTYTIVVANAGPSAVVGATVSDPMPAALATMTYTAVGGGGASGFTASGSGSIGDTVTLPVGGTITYTVQATLNAAAVGTLANTATVTPPAGVTDPTPGNNSATDVNTIIPTPQADLGITKTDGSPTYTPGATITYTIVASNAGPASVTGATVVDVLPAVITGATWTCTGAGGGTCPASGTGNINVAVNLPAGASVMFLLTGTISPSATGNLVNTATVSVPPGVVDPNPANNSATDVNTPNAVAGLSIAKVANSPTYTPGGTGIYTVTVGNNGPSNAGNVTVTDNLPAGVTLNGAPTCVATGAATCGTLAGTAGSTVFTASGATIAAGAANRLVYTLPVHFAAAMSTNPLVNIVSANDPASQSVATSSASSTLVVPGPPPVVPVPVDNRWALALLVALILAGSWRASRRRHS